MKKLLAYFTLFSLVFLFMDNAYSLCVRTSDANLRSGPGTKYKKTWEVFKYMPLKKIGSQGNWYKVKDVDGDMHWVYHTLVTDTYKCAVVKIKKANVRNGPGTKYRKNLLSPALKYYSFKVIDTKQSWVKVMDEYDDKGWIHRNLIWIQ
jgi:SH3-like domain-containing protein